MPYRVFKFFGAEFMERKYSRILLRPAAGPYIGGYGEPRPQKPPDLRSVRLVRCIPNPDIAYFFDALFNSTMFDSACHRALRVTEILHEIVYWCSQYPHGGKALVRLTLVCKAISSVSIDVWFLSRSFNDLKLAS
jgi:hypothetical protein